MLVQSSLPKNKKYALPQKPGMMAHTTGFADCPVAQCFHFCRTSTCRSVIPAPGQAVVKPVSVVKVSLAVLGAMFGLSWSSLMPTVPV